MENACELAGTFEPGPIPAGRSVPLQTEPIRQSLCHGGLVCVIIYELESFGLLGSPFDHLFYFPSPFLISFLIFFTSSSSAPGINRGKESGARIMQQLNDILDIEAFQNCHFEHLFTSTLSTYYEVDPWQNKRNQKFHGYIYNLALTM